MLFEAKAKRILKAPFLKRLYKEGVIGIVNYKALKSFFSRFRCCILSKVHLCLAKKYGGMMLCWFFLREIQKVLGNTYLQNRSRRVKKILAKLYQELSQKTCYLKVFLKKTLCILGVKSWVARLTPTHFYPDFFWKDEKTEKVYFCITMPREEKNSTQH